MKHLASAVALLLTLLTSCVDGSSATDDASPRGYPYSSEKMAFVDASQVAEALSVCGPSGGKPITLTWFDMFPAGEKTQFFVMDLAAHVEGDVSTCLLDYLKSFDAFDLGTTGDVVETGDDTTG